MRRLETGSVGLIVTFPPYNLGVNYGQYDDKKSKKDYLASTLEWVAEASRILADNGSFFLNLGGSPSNPLMPHEVVVELSDLFVLPKHHPLD